jgi:hypothetical protein
MDLKLPYSGASLRAKKAIQSTENWIASALRASQ